MNSLKSFSVAVGAIILLIVGIVYMQSSDNKGIATNSTSEVVGQGTESTNDFQCNIGVCTYFRKPPALNTATTTVCQLQSPKNATSTLKEGGHITFGVSSTTATTVTVAKSAVNNPFATTTLINQVSVGANAQATVLFSSTTESALVQTNRTFAPGEWLVVGMAGGAGNFSPTGTCEAEFLSI